MSFVRSIFSVMFIFLIVFSQAGCGGGPKAGQLGTGPSAEEATNNFESPTTEDPNLDPSKIAK